MAYLGRNVFGHLGQICWENSRIQISRAFSMASNAIRSGKHVEST